jgi:AraC-like DNA-binding protein
LSFSKQLSGL